MLDLVGDVGGTNCRFALARAGRIEPGSLRRYRNSEFPSPEAALRGYLADLGIDRVGVVCLGAAGPVQNATVQLTNYPWMLHTQTIAQATRAESVLFLNDLQAQGYALHGLARAEVTPLFTGAQSDASARRMIVAVGTGVNAAVAHVLDGRPYVPPSESGHVGLPVRDETDLAFVAATTRDPGHCPIEAALSGPGLARLWRFFGGPDTRDGAEVMAAYVQGDAPAVAALQRASLYLARLCADLAMVHLPFGGIFLSGTVGLALAPHLARLGFEKAFRRPGPYSGILAAIPVFSVPDQPLTLQGCARYLQVNPG